MRARSGSERKAVESLGDAGFSTYWPQEKRWGKRSIKGDRQKISKPLLPGYIFTPYEEGFNFRQALSVQGVTGFLPSLLPDQTISQIMAEEESGAFDYAKDRRKAQKAKKRAIALADFAKLDREEVLSALSI